jgi:hypothetical protein
MAEKRQIISRNEQNEVAPAHRTRIAGGVRFDGGVERAGVERASKVANRTSTRAQQALQNHKMFIKAASSKKRVVLDV